MLGRTHRRAAGSGRRLRSTAIVAGAVLALGGIYMLPASAVHDTGVFELDGDAINNVAPASSQDWSDVYTAQSATPKACPTGASACSFVNDGASNASIFTGGGSKDPQDISAWAWKDQAGGLPDKDNLQDSFAARYTIPANATTCQNGTSPPTGDCSLLYFGSDRLDNSGDAQEGFWFFQNKITADPATGKFVGVHKTGDLLILSDFSNGGGTSTINIYKWVGSGGDTNGTLDFLAGGNASKCGGSANDPFCGIVNPANGTTSPWPFTDKSGNSTFLNGEFYEGGVNLSDPSINLGNECFASVSSETRSSTSPTATLKDFVLGNFGECTSKTETTPKLADGTTSVPAAGTSITTAGSIQVKDSATVTATGGANVKPTGTVTFHLCGPIASPDTCDGTTGKVGTLIGSAKTLSGTENPTTVVSDAATVTSAGRYCWRAEYSGDSDKGIPGSRDSRTTECFTVLPVQPGLSTQAGAGPVSLGSAVTDTSQLSGTANKPGTPVINPTTAGGSATGTITFYLYGPGTCTTLATDFPTTGISRDVSGDGPYPTALQTAVSFTPKAVGTYHWVAVYSGDSPNTLGVTHGIDPDTHACVDSNENVVVQQLQPTISTAQRFVPNDSATITVASGGGDLAGNVRFQLFAGSTTCANTAEYDSGNIDVTTGTGSGLSRTVSSGNTKAYTSDTVFSWLVTYTTSNQGHKDVTSACDVEHSSISIDNDTTSP
jgi:hypothetical protein